VSVECGWRWETNSNVPNENNKICDLKTGNLRAKEIQIDQDALDALDATLLTISSVPGPEQTNTAPQCLGTMQFQYDYLNAQHQSSPSLFKVNSIF
jgi:hypothetical protein